LGSAPTSTDSPGGRSGGEPTNPVTYPFAAAASGQQLGRSVVGRKTFDFNNDGLAHVGLLPDLIADFQRLGITGAELDPLLNSAQGYVDVWRRAAARQPDWRWCNRCHGLFYGPSAPQSRCPAGGPHAGPSETGSWNYSVLRPVAEAPGNAQGEWRWCSNCQGLFYGPSVAKSRCPAGGTHASPSESGSWSYAIYNDGASDPHRQADWRWCSNCQGLYYGPEVARSACPAGGQHASPSESGSSNYSLIHG
jgi:hypothetical protein